MGEAKRLDVLMVEQGLALSRERAKALISAGLVFVGGVKEEKSGKLLDAGADITVKGSNLPYVSRGGLKLEKAVNAFGLQLEGAVCGDFGAATGGFTDCMLQNGASRVYSVDVGYGQLAWKLRTDPRVVSLERTNIRYLEREQIPDTLDFVSADVSFISLTLILPVVYAFLKEGGQVVCLIKPQFEAGKGKVGKKGVVRDPAVHREAIMKVIRFARSQGFRVLGLEYSPIKGPEGNIEYLVHLTKSGLGEEIGETRIGEIVSQSHTQLT